jgi:hypothetical protein
VITALTVWGARLAWLLIAVVGGQAVGGALADHGDAAARGLTIGAWVAWAVGALGLAVPSTVGLTVARVVVPGALVVTVATAIAGADASEILALGAPALVATPLVLSADLGRTWVQASAYGDEQRFPLRPPAGYLVASVASWLIWTVALIVAAVAWSDGSWLAAAVASAVVVAGVLALPRRWHQLSRRWLVLVPAGLVVHDPVVLGDTLMLPRRHVKELHLTRVGPERELTAADLTGPTAGPAVEVSLHESVTALFAPRPGLPKGRAVHLLAFVVAPSRPGAVLATAADRRLPVH